MVALPDLALGDENPVVSNLVPDHVGTTSITARWTGHGRGKADKAINYPIVSRTYPADDEP